MPDERPCEVALNHQLNVRLRRRWRTLRGAAIIPARMPEAPRKTVLITGAARRIGRAIALDLAAHGWRVGVHYRRSREEAQAVADAIGRAGGMAATLPANLADLDELQSLIARCSDAL